MIKSVRDYRNYSALNEIDWSNPITKGIIFAVDYRSPLFLKSVNTFLKPTLEEGQRSGFGYYIGTNDRLSYDRTISKFDVGLGSMAFDCKCFGGGSSVAKLVITTDNEFQLYRNGTSLEFQIGGNSQLFTSVPSIFAAGDMNDIVARWDDVNNNRAVCVSGESFEQNSSYSVTAGSTDLHIFNRADGIRGVNGDISYFILWDRYLSEYETLSISRNPRQVFKSSIPKRKNFVVSGGATIINANLESLTTTEYQATIKLDKNITANLESLAITEYQSDIKLSKNVVANLESLSTTEYQATIQLSKQVDASLEALTTNEYQSSILLSKQVDASLEALTTTEYSATIQLGSDTTINAGLEALTTTEYQSSILLSKQVDANLEALTTTEYSATIQLGSDTNINASLEALTTTEHAASILLSRQVDASLESLTTTEYSATIQLGLDTNINASLEALTTTEYSSSIQFDTIVNSAFENLTTTEYSASVILGVGLVDYESYSCLIKNTAGINSIIKNSLGLNSLII